MTNITPRILSLQKLMKLEERRASVLEELNTVVGRMRKLADGLLTASQSNPAAPRAAGSGDASPAQEPRRRGVLKERVMEALEKAGTAGVHVKDLARDLGINPVNIHSWFHSSIKRYPAIRKLEGGHYRLEAGVGSGTARKARKIATGPSQKSVNGQGTPGTRGALGARILDALRSAGTNGITVRELADKLGADYRNISVWFYTTGRNNAAIRKIGPARYHLAR